jgi:hypothetical protein
MCAQKFSRQIDKSSIPSPPSETSGFLITTTDRKRTIKERFHVVELPQEILVSHVADLVLPSKHEYLRLEGYF